MTHTRRSFLASLVALPLAVKGFFKSDNLSLLSRLRGKKVSTALYQNITTGDAIATVLDAAGWPASDMPIGKTLNYWWLDDADAFEAVHQLKEMENLYA